MTRLDRVLKLLERYDYLVLQLFCDDVEKDYAWYHLEYLRKEKEQLTQELIEHGCRRKN